MTDSVRPRQYPRGGPIFLVGFMGCGKTTVGRLLAEQLGRRFIDLDDRIAESVGKPISRIFAEDGEQRFREWECDLLRVLVQELDIVISLGGGAFVSETNRRLVNAHGVSVWLNCPFDILRERLKSTTDRPLFQSPEQLRTLWERRLPSYRRADIQIDTGRSDPEEVVQQIVHNLQRLRRTP